MNQVSKRNHVICVFREMHSFILLNGRKMVLNPLSKYQIQKTKKDKLKAKQI